ncbi:MAG: general secretion pathway protein C [Rhodoferax sp.]|jgi:general secretion pathway protein C|nr:general secretion pathway protein C [Rhodoferax sp.]
MQSLTFPSGNNPWLTGLLTLLLAGLAAGSAVFWLLKWPSPAGPARLSALPAAAPAVDSDKIARLLGAGTQAGATPVQPSLATRFKLQGVIAQGSNAARGSALIAVENAPAKPYRVGDALSEEIVLKAVKARSVVLGPSGQPNGNFTLELPLLPGMAADR